MTMCCLMFESRVHKIDTRSNIREHGHDSSLKEITRRTSGRSISKFQISGPDINISSIMNRMDSRDTIPNFISIAPSVWELAPKSIRAPKSSLHKDVNVPALIVLCTWTGAHIRHIAKYTEKYESLFPSSIMMVITTTADDLCFRSSECKQERLVPAVKRISSHCSINPNGKNTGILLHVFSEGGSNKAVELAEAYHRITTTRLPVSAMCLDSTPGHPRYLRLCNALNKSLPQIPVLRHVGLLLGGIILAYFWILYTVFVGADHNVITRTRQRLQDPKNFKLETPRCYLFSEKDALIAAQDIRDHIQESMKKGTPVKDVFFEESGHVEHAKQDPQRYWGAVMATWNNSLRDIAARASQQPMSSFRLLASRKRRRARRR